MAIALVALASVACSSSDAGGSSAASSPVPRATDAVDCKHGEQMGSTMIDYASGFGFPTPEAALQHYLDTTAKGFALTTGLFEEVQLGADQVRYQMHFTFLPGEGVGYTVDVGKDSGGWVVSADDKCDSATAALNAAAKGSPPASGSTP